MSRSLEIAHTPTLEAAYQKQGDGENFIGWAFCCTGCNFSSNTFTFAVPADLNVLKASAAMAQHMKDNHQSEVA